MYTQTLVEMHLIKRGFEFIPKNKVWTKGDMIDVKFYANEIKISKYHLGKLPMPIVTETSVSPKSFKTTEDVIYVMDRIFEFAIYPTDSKVFPNRV